MIRQPFHDDIVGLSTATNGATASGGSVARLYRIVTLDRPDGRITFLTMVTSAKVDK